MSYLNRELHKTYIEGYYIFDCAVRDKNIVYFCLRKSLSDHKASLMWDSDIATIFFALYINNPDDPFGSRPLIGYNKPRLGISIKPKNQALLTARDADGHTSVMGGGGQFPDELIAQGKAPATWKIKTINGYAYSVGGTRQVYKRVDIGTWVKIDNGLPDEEYSHRIGFDDLDGFSEENMYAVGGLGDVWHFNGENWRQMKFPSDLELATVTCAGDGWIYITGEGGRIWRGRESTWELIHTGHSSVLWNDVCWFNNQLWLSSDYQFKILDGNELINPSYDGTPSGEKVSMWGHMDARDGLLVIASTDVAMSFDGSQWRTLISPYFD